MNFRINGLRDYYQTYFSIIQPFTNLSPKEAIILATLIEIRQLLSSGTEVVKEILNKETINYVTKENNVSKNNLSVIMNNLKKKKIIVDGKIKKQYLIPYEENGGILFSLKQIEEELSN